ncbi:hypothetical protein CLOSYM_04507 [[Clostridium] symbiosum ATCC 14940]|uniref:Uncharacterized protein n=1 Tax=[Clostridium] symbiosum ATCC 14940 TaxID=411472 RepID=A0ABC9TRK2_CLOSY|nr:hypothetical protein CLOSYM_04507 [[Clostridium] symbiosum ATCC 14940]
MRFTGPLIIRRYCECFCHYMPVVEAASSFSSKNSLSVGEL